MPKVRVHKCIGQLWARKTRSGRSVLVGYIWRYDRVLKQRVVTVVRIKTNPLKTTAKAPDYRIYDYTPPKKELM